MNLKEKNFFFLNLTDTVEKKNAWKHWVCIFFSFSCPLSPSIWIILYLPDSFSCTFLGFLYVYFVFIFMKLNRKFSFKNIFISNVKAPFVCFFTKKNCWITSASHQLAILSYNYNRIRHIPLLNYAKIQPTPRVICLVTSNSFVT